MSKNKKCCKKSLLIASICLVVAFAAALIIMAVAPYSVSAYTYKTEIGSSQITTKYYVSKEKVKVNSVTVKSDGSKSKDSDEYSAYVKDGKLYVTYTGVAYSALGEIDGYNLVISEDVVASNGFAKVLRVVSFVGIGLGVAGIVVYFVKNNKNGAKKSAKKSK